MSAYWVIPVAIGLFFLFLGIGLIIWGVKEGNNYYDSLINGFDLKAIFFTLAAASGSLCFDYRRMDCHRRRCRHRRYRRDTVLGEPIRYRIFP